MKECGCESDVCDKEKLRVMMLYAQELCERRCVKELCVKRFV